MNLAVITATAGADSFWEALTSWGTGVCYKYSGDERETLFNRDGLVTDGPIVLAEDGTSGMLPAYQNGFQRTDGCDILAYFHDDLIIHDKDWLSRVLAEFEDPKVGLVGFGGALGHGTAGLYRDPYEYHQLARVDFMSNMTDAENHGKRFTGSCDVAVLDGFALIVRRDVLDRIGGWPLDTPIGYICYDYWLCCAVRRLGYRIRLCGVSCQHLGGRTFVKLGIGKDPKHWTQYLESHRYIYDTFRDCLPYRVSP